MHTRSPERLGVWRLWLATARDLAQIMVSEIREITGTTEVRALLEKQWVRGKRQWAAKKAKKAKAGKTRKVFALFVLFVFFAVKGFWFQTH
jgi:hypothetical protein